MIYPKSSHCGHYTSPLLASVLKSPANARLKQAFEKVTGAELCIAPASTVIMFGAPSEEAVSQVEAALQEIESALTVPPALLKSILKNNGF